MNVGARRKRYDPTVTWTTAKPIAAELVTSIQKCT